jgi:hypothetical protein
MLEISAYEHLLVEQFLKAIRELPDVHATLMYGKDVASSGRRDEAHIDVCIGSRALLLQIEVKKRAIYPRDVREILWQFKQHGRSQPNGQGAQEPQSLLVAESISPGAKDLLRAERVGYYDSGGSLFLPALGTYIYIDKPPPKTLAKSMRSLFSGRRAQVLHTLLAHPQNWFGVKKMAEQAQVSPATASQVLTELERFEWLDMRGQGPTKERHLREPGAALDTWVKQLASFRPQIQRRYYVPDTRVDRLLERVGQVFARHHVNYAFSHEAAAQRYAPLLSNISQVRCRTLQGQDTEAAISELRARLVSEGANLVIIQAKSLGELLFRERVGELWLASPIQVYLDLLGGEGRAKELAEHLRKERIGF